MQNEQIGEEKRMLRRLEVNRAEASFQGWPLLPHRSLQFFKRAIPSALAANLFGGRLEAARKDEWLSKETKAKCTSDE